MGNLPTPSFEAVGIWIVIAIGLGHFYFAWKKSQATDRQALEPRHEPSIDVKIRSETTAVESRLRGEIAALSDEVQLLHNRVSGLRGEMKTDTQELRARIDDVAKQVEALATATAREMGGLIAEVKHLTVATNALTVQLQRHIEQEARKRHDA